MARTKMTAKKNAPDIPRTSAEITRLLVARLDARRAARGIKRPLKKKKTRSRIMGKLHKQIALGSREKLINLKKSAQGRKGKLKKIGGGFIGAPEAASKKRKRKSKKRTGISAAESVSTGFNPANEASFQKMRKRLQAPKKVKMTAIDREIKAGNNLLFAKEKAAAKRKAKKAAIPASHMKLPAVPSYKPPKPKKKTLKQKLAKCLEDKGRMSAKIHDLASLMGA
jgi:hypothetical protein